MVGCKESVEDISKDYFRSISTLAQKITDDIEDTKEAYLNLWDTLSENEQKQAIDSSIISQTAVIKYTQCHSLFSNRMYPYAYTWFTKSQVDLFKILTKNEEWMVPKLEKPIYVDLHNNDTKIGGNIKRNISNSIDTSDILSKIKNKVTGYKSGNYHADEKQSLISSNKIIINKSAVSKPKNPPPPPPSHFLQDEESENLINNFEKYESNDSIPKTGFDFLDNW